MLSCGEWYTTLETKVNFIRPIAADTGPVRCEGVVISRGRWLQPPTQRLRCPIPVGERAEVKCQLLLTLDPADG
jgi:hypothetical protein